jgi:membrane-bound metal-dependent hydrolase YbcI (DUF457 family)
MDTLAHALYGSAIVAHTRDEKKIFTAAAAGMMPDLVTYAVALASGHNLHDVNLTLYYTTHSLFIPTTLLVILPKRWKVYAVPYFLHVLFDIFTHCNSFSTQIFFPLSNLSFCTFNYTDHWWAWELNYGVIILLYYVIYLKWYKPFLRQGKPV